MRIKPQHETAHQVDDDEMLFFPLESSEPRHQHQRLLLGLVLRHVGTRRGERIVIDEDGRLTGVETTRSTFAGMIREAEGRARHGGSQ